MQPGPVLAAFLSTVETARLSTVDRLRVLKARQRMASHYEAQIMRDTAAVVDGYLDDDGLDADEPENVEWATAEIRAALHLTRASADRMVRRAIGVRDRIPAVVAMVVSGDLDVPRMLVIDEATAHVDGQIRDAAVRAVLPEAAELTTGQLRARMRRLLVEAEPEAAERRLEDAMDRRRVELRPGSGGAAEICGSGLPPHRAEEISRRINAIARGLRGDGETRTMDQLRADVFMDLLTGTSEDRLGRGVVDIRVDLQTLSGLAAHPGDLGGYGPVVADIARQTAEQNPQAEWRYLVTDPETNQPIAIGTTNRRPSAEQRRIVELFHPRCVFPGCRMPATECDLDHRVEWSAGGPTTVGNLVPVCRTDHRIRHEAGWRHRFDVDGGHIWTSPTGATYRVRPTEFGDLPPPA